MRVLQAGVCETDLQLIKGYMGFRGVLGHEFVGQVVECDTVVLCAGQQPLRELQAPLQAAGVTVHLIGGADEAAELDAKRAIGQGTRLAAQL